MHAKEPYYSDELTSKAPLKITAALFKIPLTTDLVHLTEKIETPAHRGLLRRGLMEPYYKSSRRNTNPSSLCLSSYALLSDVFDYHYRAEEHENAIASDSDTDYEDDDVDTKECLDSDSELEDYNVHFLMFKVNSSAQFTRPPRNSVSAVSDCFDATPESDYLEATRGHPKFAAPRFNKDLRTVDFLDELVTDTLQNFVIECSNPLNVTNARLRRASESANVLAVGKIDLDDCYSGNPTTFGVSDAYDVTPGSYYI